MYMAGDYYSGDYYQGSIFSAIGGVIKGAAKGFALGGPLGAIAGARAGLPAKRQTSSSGGNPGNLPMVLPPAPQIVPFGPTAPGGRIQAAGIPGHIRRGGGFSAAGQHKLLATQDMPLMLAMHKRRRMNVANPRALRRSLRRVAGFAKLTKRVRRAVSMAASAVGVHRRASGQKIPRR